MKEINGFNGGIVKRVVTPSIWDSGFRTIPPRIVVSRKLMRILAVVQDHAGQDEFSILFKGNWDSSGFKVSDEYYIPKQAVHGSSVEYEENIGELRENEGFNVIVHSHPFDYGEGGFSPTDESHINSHFDCSLLYTSAKKVDINRLLVRTKDYVIRLENVKVFIVDEPIEGIEGLENIRRVTTSCDYEYYYGYDYDDYLREKKRR